MEFLLTWHTKKPLSCEGPVLQQEDGLHNLHMKNCNHVPSMPQNEDNHEVVSHDLDTSFGLSAPRLPRPFQLLCDSITNVIKGTDYYTYTSIPADWINGALKCCIHLKSFSSVKKRYF